MPEPAADPLSALDGSRARPRARIAVGAAVALFVVAVAVSAIASFVGGGGGAQGEVVPAASVDGTGDVAAGGAPASGTTTTEGAADILLVHVLGAVAEPGIVELAPGSRVVDAVAAAGGLTAEADPGGVNLARALVDGEQLVVPKVGEVPPPASASGGTGAGAGGAPAAGGAGGRVSLNSADVAALDTLPRIGPALAQRIIDWREANGPFTDVSQLLEVTGIGDAVYSGLVDLVSL
ncbi:helix-hairpin-helix domain-containing protein [Agromyces sp. NPDC056523]|uniref:helix-hairpin-helix domain-containing protein n=1 Tax=Agromyces sp. NPDC056523 TaxID=3345850 RepID=UPI00366AE604